MNNKEFMMKFFIAILFFILISVLIFRDPIGKFLKLSLDSESGIDYDTVENANLDY